MRLLFDADRQTKSAWPTSNLRHPRGKFRDLVWLACRLSPGQAVFPPEGLVSGLTENGQIHGARLRIGRASVRSATSLDWVSYHLFGVQTFCSPILPL